MKRNIRALIKELGRKMKELDLSLVTAESCTGGGLAYSISQIPAASSILERAFVTYSVKAKHELLKVKYTTIKKYGAVSTQTAREMVLGALKNSGAQVSVAITGLAGPDSDKTSTKPIGFICIGIADNKKRLGIFSKKFNGSRQQISEKTISYALKNLIQFVEARKE